MDIGVNFFVYPAENALRNRKECDMVYLYLNCLRQADNLKERK